MFKSLAHYQGTQIKFDLFLELLTKMAEIIYENDDEHKSKNNKDKFNILVDKIFNGGFFDISVKLPKINNVPKKRHCLSINYGRKNIHELVIFIHFQFY